MDRSEERGDPGRSHSLTLAGLFVFAVALRAAAALRTSVIFADGPSFVRLAERMQAGDWQAVFLHPYHPLYPAAIWGLSGWTGDLEVAGVAASILAGGVSVLALYGFLCAAFDRPGQPVTGGAAWERWVGQAPWLQRCLPVCRLLGCKPD